MLAAGVILTLVPPFFIGPILFVAGLFIGIRGMTKTAVTGVKLTSSAVSALAGQESRNASEQVAAASGQDFNRAKWSTLLEVDPEIREAADEVGKLGPRYVEQLAYKYLSVDDKSYLPAIVDSIVRAAKDDQLRDEAAKQEQAREHAALLEREREQSLRQRAMFKRYAPIVGGCVAIVVAAGIIFQNFIRTTFPDSDLSAPKVWGSEEAAVLFLLRQADAGVTDPAFHSRWTSSGPTAELHGEWSDGKPHFEKLSVTKTASCKYSMTSTTDQKKTTMTVDISKMVAAEKGNGYRGLGTAIILKGSVDEFYCTQDDVSGSSCGGAPYPRGEACRKDYKCPKDYNPMIVWELPETYPDRMISAYRYLRSKCS